MNRLVLLLVLLLVLSGAIGVSLATWTGDDGPHVIVTIKNPPAPPAHERGFYSAASIPGPDTRTGAEIRSLRSAIEAVPEGLRSLLRATTANGGLIRQNTHSSCYLNGAGTERVCSVVVRRGAKPWAEFRLNVVAATGQVVYHGYTVWAP